MDKKYSVTTADPSGYWLIPDGVNDPSLWACMDSADPVEEIENLHAKLAAAENDLAMSESMRFDLELELAAAEKDKARLVGRLKEVLDAATGTIDPMMGAVPTSVLEKVRAAIDGAKEE